MLAPGKRGYKGCRLWPWAATNFLLGWAQHGIWGLVMKCLNSHIFRWGNCTDAGPTSRQVCGDVDPLEGSTGWSGGRVGSFTHTITQWSARVLGIRKSVMHKTVAWNR